MMRDIYVDIQGVFNTAVLYNYYKQVCGFYIMEIYTYLYVDFIGFVYIYIGV